MRSLASTIRNAICKNRKTKAAAIVTSLAVIAATAAAFYVLTVSGSGSQTATLGSSGNTALTVRVSGLTDGLIPGGTSPVTINATNSSGQAASVAGINYSFSTDNPQCNPAWFSATNTGSFPVGLADGHDNQIGAATVSFNDSGTDQSACSAAHVTVTATVH